MLFCGGRELVVSLTWQMLSRADTRSSRVVEIQAGPAEQCDFSLSLCQDFLVNFEMGVLFYSKAQELGDMKRGGRGDMD